MAGIRGRVQTTQSQTPDLKTNNSKCLFFVSYGSLALATVLLEKCSAFLGDCLKYLQTNVRVLRFSEGEELKGNRGLNSEGSELELR